MHFICISCIISLMPDFDFINLIVLILAASSAGGFFYLQRKHVPPPEEQSLEEKSYQTVHSAAQKAQAILGMAELDAIKVTADTRFYKEKLEGKFEEEIQEATEATRDLIREQTEKAIADFNNYLEQLKADLENKGKDYSNYLNYLKSDADAEKNQNQDIVKQQINQIFVKFEENLSQFLMDSQQRSVQSIELELKAARQLIETYKQQQLKVIDENVIAMLEKTLSLVLTKKLSLQDQVELVYEALEKAKAEKFIV